LKAVAQAGLDRGIDLHLARVKPQVLEVLERDGFFEVASRDHVHDNIAAAAAFHAAAHRVTDQSVGGIG
jgi:hypothetical protein